VLLWFGEKLIAEKTQKQAFLWNASNSHDKPMSLNQPILQAVKASKSHS